MTKSDTLRRLYPEVGAGGFSKVDGTIQFYQRINALVEPHMTILDLGAGRGEAHLDDEVPYRRALRLFKGKAHKVIGADLDAAVLENISVDEALVIPDDTLPLEDESVDLIFSDYTFEHVQNAAVFADEIDRVLKPGGWLCARTPNKFGYISLAARLVPNSLHAKVLKVAQPNRKEEDIFPTFYRLNTGRAIRRNFPASRWEHHIYGWNAEPAYFGRSALLWRFARTMSSLVPDGMAATLMVFSRKK